MAVPGARPAVVAPPVNAASMSEWEDLGTQEYCYLTTTGRVTGNPHTIEIWFAAVGDTAYLLSGGRERADWVRNAIAEPTVTIRIADRDYAGEARLVSDPDEDAAARGLLYAKYNPSYGGDLASWRDEALVIAIERLGP